MQNKTAILLIGSPKIFKSSSGILGKLLLQYLAEKGINTEFEHIGTAQRKGTINELIQKINNADITIIATPLYVDSLPAPLTDFLEKYQNNNQKSDKKLVGILNSGFPEAVHNNTGIDILRLFAIHNSFEWSGGFAIGGGGALNSPDIEKSKMAKNVVESFKVASEHLSKGENIPTEVLDRASRAMISPSVYSFIGQLGWYLQAVKHHTLFRLGATPYIE